MCGSKDVITVTGTESTGPNLLSLYSDWIVGEPMNNGAICRYLLDFPNEADIYDEITVSARFMNSVVAYITETDSFDSPDPKQGSLRFRNDSFTAVYPRKVYLTIVADSSNQNAEFELLMTFTDRDGDTLLAQDLEA